MSRFQFCPTDGTKLEATEGEGGRCPKCDATWHDNPAPTVGATIIDAGRALITQRAREPDKGRWDIPGGFLHPGEDPIDGLKRELDEELGIEIDADERDCLDISAAPYGSDGNYVVAIGFRAHLVAGEPEASDDVAAFKWIGIDEVDSIDFAWEHDRELVRRALSEDR